MLHLDWGYCIQYRFADMVLTRCWVLQMERGNRESWSLLSNILIYLNICHGEYKTQIQAWSWSLHYPDFTAAASQNFALIHPKFATTTSTRWKQGSALCAAVCHIFFVLLGILFPGFPSKTIFNIFTIPKIPPSTPNLAGYPCPKPCYFSFRQTLAQALLVTCTTYNWFIHYTVIPINYINPVLPGIKEVI